MSYEDQLIREATGEGMPSFQEVHEDYLSNKRQKTQTQRKVQMKTQAQSEISKTTLRKVGQFWKGQLDRQNNRPCMSANGAYLDGWYSPDKAIPPYVTESEFNEIKRSA